MLQLFQKKEPEPIQEQIQIQRPKTVTFADLAFQNAIIEERDREIRAIADEMREVNKLTKAVADLVDQQGDMVDTIQNNITTTNVHTRKANKDLLEAEESAETSNKIGIWVAIGTAITVTTSTLIAIFV